MADVTATVKRTSIGDQKVLQKHYQTSTANQSDVIKSAVLESAKANTPKQILGVLIKYSANVTLSVTVSHNSATPDVTTLLATAALVAQADVYWQPDEEMWIEADDTIDVAVPAGGAGVTATVQIFFKTQDGF